MFSAAEINSLIQQRDVITDKNAITKSFNNEAILVALSCRKILSTKEIMSKVHLSRGIVHKWINENSCIRHGSGNNVKWSLS